MDTEGQEDRWKAVLARDKRFDGAFVYGVHSTNIYCRPSCPARKPRQDQVSFFRMPEAAKQAGFRPCLRCRPDEAINQDPQVNLIQRLCRYIENYDSLEEPLTLAVMGKHVQVSPYHLQRIFKRNMGITPKQYAEACRVSRLKGLFKNGKDVTSALYEAGYGSSSRLYEGASIRLGMTPGTYLRGGKGMRIRYTIINSPLGRLLVAATNKGISAVSIGKCDAALEGALFDEYPAAEISRDETGLGEYVNALLKYVDGKQPNLNLPLDIRVTAFQWRVYETLRAIPYGETRSYTEIAETIGHPKAVRAVAQACASNPTALIVPCHRVVRKNGHPGGYRWGTQTKRTLLAKEKIAAQSF
ncbi:MAG: bifunctional DNA-binding transcriptional regulator/O6-methylguanine-DNA methyltransferase Ada [Deltaproteobacteria bacterium]|nr:bifunctional DNA-binding transcriptional regulator/O6-methylguanine-DNA methyltransferase Ada [Deltaproteobacteria bacterium]